MEIFSSAKPTVLVVDDTPANLALLVGLLQSHYGVKAVNNGARALALAEFEPPDLILLDVTMPGMDGYEVCRALKSNPRTRQIPVIFLTSRDEVEDEQYGLALGAVDYITRPVNPPILLSRVRAHAADASFAKTMRVNNEYLEFEVAKRTRQLAALQDVTILALASLAEKRDADTGNHLRRTQHYMRALSQQLQSNPRFKNFLTDETVELLFKCAPLHDIGKVGIPDRILLKPGRYEPEEFEVMKTHPELGRDALLHAGATSGEMLDFLEIAKDIVYSHHEKWDGSGYPLGLVGDAIPIAGRLMALADVYDALISPRVYKEGMTHAQAAEIIMQGKGRHFDPDMADAFSCLGHEFQAISNKFNDTQAELISKAQYLGMVL